jgi:UDP-glucose 4-epimerase
MIMITGGMGFIGSSMAKILCEQGEKILLADPKQKELAPFLEPYRDKNLFITRLDIIDFEGVEKTIKQYKIKSIIHAAAVYESTGTFYDAMRVNIIGTINVLEASQRHGIERTSMMSTEAVYQGIKQVAPLKEDQLLFVESDRYIPGTKRAEENLALLYAKIQGLDIILIRASRVFGPLSIGFRNPINLMTEAAVYRNVCDLTDIDEDEGHDNLYVKDCARGVVMVHTAKKLNHRIYNLGTGKLTTFGEIRDAVLKIVPKTVIHLGKNLRDITPTKSPLDINACLDINRIKEELGFEPEYDVNKGMRAYIAWIKDKQYI